MTDLVKQYGAWLLPIACLLTFAIGFLACNLLWQAKHATISPSDTTLWEVCQEFNQP